MRSTAEPKLLKGIKGDYNILAEEEYFEKLVIVLSTKKPQPRRLHDQAATQLGIYRLRLGGAPGCLF
jgi:hypothetical protein